MSSEVSQARAKAAREWVALTAEIAAEDEKERVARCEAGRLRAQRDAVQKVLSEAVGRMQPEKTWLVDGKVVVVRWREGNPDVQPPSYVKAEVTLLLPEEFSTP